MKISVVMATWRRPQLLQQCLRSLLAQTFNSTDYEVIVVSDGADAVTEDVIKKLASSTIHFYALPAKKGPAAARNFGWQKARGTLIAFTDDDTMPATGWLQNIWTAFTQKHQPQLIAFAGRIVVPLQGIPTDYELNTAQLEKAEFVTANCVCTKAALQKVSGFDERFATAWREDSDLEFKLLKAYIPIVHLADAVIVHPVRKASWGVSLKEQRKSMYNALLYKKYPDLYRQKIQPKPAFQYYYIIAASLLFVTALLLQINVVSIVALAVWLLLTITFTARRLAHTSHAFSHVAEMIFTSLLIPFLSVYWTLYGARKFRVLFF